MFQHAVIETQPPKGCWVLGVNLRGQQWVSWKTRFWCLKPTFPDTSLKSQTIYEKSDLGVSQFEGSTAGVRKNSFLVSQTNISGHLLERHDYLQKNPIYEKSDLRKIRLTKNPTYEKSNWRKIRLTKNPIYEKSELRKIRLIKIRFLIKKIEIKSNCLKFRPESYVFLEGRLGTDLTSDPTFEKSDLRKIRFTKNPTYENQIFDKKWILK